MSADRSFGEARARARQVANSDDYVRFAEKARARFPQRSEAARQSFERDYVDVVDHHLESLLPRLTGYMAPEPQRVLDFGCGSGGSAIALTLVYPRLFCWGTDVDADEVSIAGERAALYGVADRCDFRHVPPNERLPFDDGFFDLCLCSSVLEYVVDRAARAFCVREMTRLIRPGGLMVISVPNRLYPFEIHSWWRGRPKWGWNYFPKLLKADTVDCTVWEVQKLARPASLKLYRTPVRQLFKPWSTFCLQRELS
jgi:SAM-dependent methyltransferase